MLFFPVRLSFSLPFSLSLTFPKAGLKFYVWNQSLMFVPSSWDQLSSLNFFVDDSWLLLSLVYWCSDWLPQFLIFWWLSLTSTLYSYHCLNKSEKSSDLRCYCFGWPFPLLSLVIRPISNEFFSASSHRFVIVIWWSLSLVVRKRFR